LLRNGGSSASAIAFQIVFGSDLDLVPIESMVLVEVGVLCGDHSVLEIGRDLAERNEFVALAIRRVVNPGLQAALDVHRACRWVDPPGGHKGQCGKRPKKHHADDKPANKGSAEARPQRSFGVCVQLMPIRLNRCPEFRVYDSTPIRHRTASRASETLVRRPCSARCLRNCSFMPSAVA
jgi:hypothetical protein